MVPRIHNKFDFSRLTGNVLGVPWPGGSHTIVTPARVDHCNPLKQRFGKNLPTHHEGEFLLGEVVSGLELLSQGAFSRVQLRRGVQAVAAKAMAVARDLADLRGRATRAGEGAVSFPSFSSCIHVRPWPGWSRHWGGREAECRSCARPHWFSLRDRARLSEFIAGIRTTQ